MGSSKSRESYHQYLQAIPSQGTAEKIQGNFCPLTIFVPYFICQVLFCEEERILEEFKKVKLQLKEKSMDEEEFDATRETCMLLGGKLMDIRAKQHRCYSDNEDLEIIINKEIMAIR